jgi:diguanylate cyclase (GGDEF)-like protein
MTSPDVVKKDNHPKSNFAVLYLDLDRYQTVKYSLGHWVADQLVAATVRRLKNSLDDDVELARVGSDEFAILLPTIQEPNDAIQVADLIHQVMQAPFQFSDRPMVFSSTSIGIVFSQIGYQTPEQFLTAAATAMNHAKLQGQGKTALFDLQMQYSAIESLHLEAELKKAIQSEQLHLNYQPIICLKTGKLAGFEALVRWRHPKLGIISPGKFIPMAEETGWILPLGELVLKKACHQLSMWQDQFPDAGSITLSVNLSGIQLANPDLVLTIEKILSQYGLNGSSLKLEITESVLMENAGIATAILDNLKAHNIKVSIDDFGTGYSSLSYLHCLPIDTLKIDQSFVSNMESQPKNATLVKSIVALAHSLELDLVAEGVETPKQMTILRSLGCEYGQGYLFSRPLEAEAAEHLLENMPQISHYWQKSS